MQEPAGELEPQVSSRDQILSKIDGILKVEDREKRKQEFSNFTSGRLESLTKASLPKEISLLSSPYKGFIHPESKIVRNFLVDPFSVDDNEIYKSLLDSFAEFEDSPGWQGKSLREIVPSAVIRTIGNYFGNYWGTDSSESENRAFYMDHVASDSTKISLSEFKGKRFAVCAEKAAVAQNLLAFLGYDVELIASSKCRLDSSEQDNQGGHMYNVISNKDSHFIFDPTNPALVEDGEGNAVSFMPPAYKIGEEEYQKLKGGGQVEVTHSDYKKMEDGKIVKGAEIKRIYGGPSQAAV